MVFRIIAHQYFVDSVESVHYLKVLDSILYSQIQQGGAAIWHQSLDNHSVDWNRALLVQLLLCVFNSGHYWTC